jgi:tetratricopeptide (TPR) repeat protein
VPIDRDDTLKKAEKLVRQGKVDAAIAEYLRVVEDQPRDWTTVNTLGDLYVRAGQPGQAAAQFARIAEHFMTEGFYPKASAIYKKLLKLTPDDESAQLNLAELSQKQGLLADAKAQLNAIEARRRRRGDRAGAAEIVVRRGALDPADFDARSAGARTLAEMGHTDEAAASYRSIHDDLLEKDRPREAFDALRRSVELNPQDREGRATLAKTAVEAGDFESARRFLDRETAGTDQALQLALLEIEFKGGRVDAARELLPGLLQGSRDQRQRVVDLAWSLAGSNPEAAFVVVEAAADAAVAQSEFGDAAAILKEFVTRIPRQVPALLKLVEVCVDGGLEAAMYETQAELADAYLATGQPAEARLIAEDLVAREPWEQAHIERFRRALVMLKVFDPDSLIAVRLSGQEPFTAKDIFAPPAPSEPESAPTPPDGGATAGLAAEVPSSSTLVGDPPAASPETETDMAAVALEPPAAAQPQIVAEPDGHDLLAEIPPQPGQVAAPEAAPDSAAEQMALARAYLDMNMPDEALAPLKTACAAIRFRFEAASLLGRLHRQRGEALEAIEWFERAAEAPAPSEDEGHSLLYDLGTLVEASGDTSRALAVFLELQSDAGAYRDVAERVERLARVETGG